MNQSLTSAATALPSWALMWVIALALFLAAKAVTLGRARRELAGAPAGRSLGYLVGWVGLDARTFLRPGPWPAKPGAAEWAQAVAKTAFGALLLWVVARRMPGEGPLAGWVGLVGLVFVLHFGSFHLLSLLWRRCGVQAWPIMRSPARSESLGEFWGKRWNVAFHRLARDLVYKPCRGRLGIAGATLLAFAASGLVHDLVISVPAGGGHGLPTVYFLCQGLGLLLERSRAGRRLGLGRGTPGYLYTAAVTVLPVGLLFPPPFIERVAIPFLRAAGAL